MRNVIAATLCAFMATPLAPQEVDVLVSADWVSERLEDASVVVLHAEMRESRYAAGHIPGARFLDMTQLVWDGDPAWGTEMRSPAEIDAALEAAGVSDGQHIVVYAGNALYAARAFMTLEVMGLKGMVSMLDGGFGGWQEEGREVSSEASAVARGSIRLHPTDDIRVSADWIHERLDDASIALVDARPDDEYTGADGRMRGAQLGHIPGAAQMYWEELVVDRSIPRVHDEQRLGDLFAEAGADEGDTVVAYCMVGLRASFTYFSARLLGYDTKFYDGSWRDWGTRDDLPRVMGTARR